VNSYTFLLDTYATERLKTLSVWSHFDEKDLGLLARTGWAFWSTTPKPRHGASSGWAPSPRSGSPERRGSST